METPVHFLNVQYLFYQLYILLTTGIGIDGNALLYSIAYVWGWVTLVSFLLSLVFLFIVLYSWRRLAAFEERDHARYGHAHGPYFEKEKKNERWEQIVKHLESDNPNDWRLAIIEADIILDEMVKSMGYQGDSLGERLKRVEESDFNSINAAWEAHKVRNQIAHAGSDYLLTHREARRVIGLFKQVFEEFEYI